MIKLACPNCAKQLAVEDSTAGSVCKCPACASKFRVPEAAKPEREAATKSRPTDSKRAGGRDSGAGQVSEKSSSSPGKARSPRDSATGSGNRSSRSASAGPAGSKAGGSNGITLDKLEVVDEEEALPRQPRKRSRPEPTPTWVYIVSAVGGVLGCGLLGLAFFFKAFAISMIVIGLPVSLLSRKWQLLGAVGVGYLLSGAGLYVLHNSLFQRVDGPPPENATARGIDSHCELLLKDPNKKEAKFWVGMETPSDTSVIKGLRALIKGAYDSGSPKVWLTNTDRKDESGQAIPNMIVVLPDDDRAREHVLSWYQSVRHKRVAGEKYLYVEWD